MRKQCLQKICIIEISKPTYVGTLRIINFFIENVSLLPEFLIQYLSIPEILVDLPVPNSAFKLVWVLVIPFIIWQICHVMRPHCINSMEILYETACFILDLPLQKLFVHFPNGKVHSAFMIIIPAMERRVIKVGSAHWFRQGVARTDFVFLVVVIGSHSNRTWAAKNWRNCSRFGGWTPTTMVQFVGWVILSCSPLEILFISDTFWTIQTWWPFVIGSLVHIRNVLGNYVVIRIEWIAAWHCGSWIHLPTSSPTNS